MKRLLALCLLTTSSLAQVALPNPPIDPPNPSAGAVASSGSTPNTQWSTLLGESLYFYEAQRSGKLPSTNRVSWRNDSAVNDGSDVNLDLSGGYYDAGDYIKCTYPLSFAVMSICWGALDYGTGYDSANQTAYLDDMLRWSLDWLIKVHPENNTLYVQVADSDLDNAYWGGDLNIPDPRPSFPINDTHPGTDAAAQASAAFGACSALYASRAPPAPFDKRASLQNDTYAATLLGHAQSLYAFAANASGGQMTYQTSVPVAGLAYASSSYQDELVIAALWLASAENSTELYSEAEAMYKQYELGGFNGVFNWDSKTPGLAVLFSQLAQAGLGADQSKWQTEAENYFDNIINNGGPGHLTSGLLFSIRRRSVLTRF
ncbi:glycoside hydrolase family 9 protein [Athelia psychrophila]|uniref:cellulase n=1 Tax=Athelia psychrophila TaxID=1759441 RepID=A0A166N125_9AGAM|nr:glycoside hydrolase family 9 protein [Fibularhizoctonia sp. CBS 109695]